MGFLDALARRVCNPRRRGRPNGVHVPQPAARFLDVAFEQVGQLAEPLLTRRGGRDEFREALVRLRAPVLVHFRTQGCCEEGVAGDVSRVEKTECGLEIRGRHGDRFVDGAHRVVELHPAVPDGIPELLRQRGDVAAAAVDEHQVQVAAGGRVAAAIGADRQQGDTVCVPDQLGQPRVREAREAGTQLRALRGVGEQLGASGSELRRRQRHAHLCGCGRGPRRW